MSNSSGSIWSAGTNSTTSISWPVATGSESRSSSLRVISSPSSVSKPLTMSAYSTSCPSSEQVRLYLIRPPSAAWTWWNRMSWFVVAAYALTGTLTSPNDTAPLHIARIRLDLPAVSHLDGM